MFLRTRSWRSENCQQRYLPLLVINHSDWEKNTYYYQYHFVTSSQAVESLDRTLFSSSLRDTEALPNVFGTRQRPKYIRQRVHGKILIFFSAFFLQNSQLYRNWDSNLRSLSRILLFNHCTTPSLPSVFFGTPQKSSLPSARKKNTTTRHSVKSWILVVP